MPQVKVNRLNTKHPSATLESRLLLAVGDAGTSKQATPVGPVQFQQTTTSWKHYDYTLNPDFSLRSVDRDPSAIVDTQFDAYTLENDYLKVTLVPEFGGRILSIYNKSTGKEELYQNPVGAPYLEGEGIFYYDWLMIYGGIFPTFPEPEHGKSWLREWDFEVVEQSEDQVTVMMSYTDDDSFAGAPGNYNAGTTGVEVQFFVTLHADRTAVDTEVKIINPKNRAVPNFEYWLDTTLAPGSEPGNTRTTEHAEIIAPIEETKLIYGFDGEGKWENIKWYKNHQLPGTSGEGIAYPTAPLGDGNFWGVINHRTADGKEEGLFRIADNRKTPGLKIWSFGYPATQVNPFVGGQEWRRPAIELWAGTTAEFFADRTLQPNQVITLEEVFTPSVGLSNVTHANENVLLNLSGQGLQLYFVEPAQQYQVTITQNGKTLQQAVVTPDPATGNVIAGDYSGAGIEVAITDEQGRTVYGSPPAGKNVPAASSLSSSSSAPPVSDTTNATVDESSGTVASTGWLPQDQIDQIYGQIEMYQRLQTPDAAAQIATLVKLLKMYGVPAPASVG